MDVLLFFENFNSSLFLRFFANGSENATVRSLSNTLLKSIIFFNILTTCPNKISEVYFETFEKTSSIDLNILDQLAINRLFLQDGLDLLFDEG